MSSKINRSTIYIITFVANLKTKCEVLITVNNIFAVLVLNLLYLWWWYWQRYGATLLLNSSRRLYFIISKSTVRAFKWHKNYLLKEWNSRKQQPCCPLLKRKFIYLFPPYPHNYHPPILNHSMPLVCKSMLWAGGGVFL